MAVNANDVIKAVWWAQNSIPNAGVRQAFYFRATDPGNGNETDIADDMGLIVAGIWQQVVVLLTTDYIGEKVYVTNETQRKFMGDPAVTFAGTDAGNDLPGPDCGLVIARTGFLGQQGRKYIGPVGVANQTEGNWDPPALTALNNFAQQYSAQQNGVNSGAVLDPGVARYPGNLQPPTFTAFDPTLAAVLPRLRTQRRRRSNVGL